jgi:sarcosine oxidase, subunit gamma
MGERRGLERDPLASLDGALESIAERSGGRVTARAMPFIAQVSLRLEPSLAGRAPLPLPTTPNTAWEAGPRAALWLGPDEWLVLGPPHAGAEIVAELDRALDGAHRSVVDVSSDRVALELGGRGRFDLLAGGCSLDLHPRTWAVGSCAQTLFARAQVILYERTDSTGILVRSSFAAYLVARLTAEL